MEKDVVTSAKSAKGSISPNGAQANGNIVTVNIDKIKVFTGYTIEYKYGKTEIEGNQIPIKYWDYNGKTKCRITDIDSAAYLVEYRYNDKQGKEQIARKVIVPGKDGTIFKTSTKDGFKNYVLETTYVNKFGVVTPNHKFTWAIKVQ